MCYKLTRTCTMRFKSSPNACAPVFCAKCDVDSGDISTNEKSLTSSQFDAIDRCATSSATSGVSFTLGDKLGRKESKSKTLLPLPVLLVTSS